MWLLLYWGPLNFRTTFLQHEHRKNKLNNMLPKMPLKDHLTGSSCAVPGHHTMSLTTVQLCMLSMYHCFSGTETNSSTAPELDLANRNQSTRIGTKFPMWIWSQREFRESSFCECRLWSVYPPHWAKQLEEQWQKQDGSEPAALIVTLQPAVHVCLCMRRHNRVLCCKLLNYC